MKKLFFLLAFFSLSSLSFASVNPVDANDECEVISMFDCNGDAGACSNSLSSVLTVPTINFVPFGGAPTSILATCNTQNFNLVTGFYAITLTNPGINAATIEYKYSFCSGSVEGNGVSNVPGGTTVTVGFIFIP